MKSSTQQSINQDVEKLITTYFTPDLCDPFTVEASVEDLIGQFLKQNPRFNLNNEIDGAICARLRFRAKQIGDTARYERAMGVIT